jgi:hypothetical protein
VFEEAKTAAEVQPPRRPWNGRGPEGEKDSFPRIACPDGGTG